MDKVHVSLQRLQSSLDKYPLMQQAEAKTGVPKLYLAGGAVSFIVLLLFVGFGPALLTNIVGFAYPTVASFKAINNKNADSVTQWLSYWVLFSSINIFEQFLFIIGLVIPYFHGIKFGLLLWLFLPQTMGARFCWDQLLSPLAAQIKTQLQGNGPVITKAE